MFRLWPISVDPFSIAAGLRFKRVPRKCAKHKARYFNAPVLIGKSQIPFGQGAQESMSIGVTGLTTPVSSRSLPIYHRQGRHLTSALAIGGPLSRYRKSFRTSTNYHQVCHNGLPSNMYRL